MVLVAFWALPSTEALVVYRTDLRQIPLCGVYFLVGATLYQFKLNKYFSLSNVVLALVLWLCLSRHPQLFAMASWVVLPFGVLAFGLAATPGLAAGTNAIIPTAFTFTLFLSSKLWCPSGPKCHF
jgi:hypothetical protein